jgi:hypothetical protein
LIHRNIFNIKYLTIENFCLCINNVLSNEGFSYGNFYMILIFSMLFVQSRTEGVQHQLELLPFTFDAYGLSIHGIIHKAYTHRINNIHDILIFIIMLLHNHHKRTNRDQIIHYFFIITFNYHFN